MSTYHKTQSEIKDELKLIKAAQRNPARFGPLYESYYQQIFLFIYKRVDDEMATGDITSQVFMKAISNIRSYKFKGVPFSAWLFRIASNEVNQFFRKTKRQRTVNIDSHGVELMIDEIDQGYDKDALTQLLVKAIDHLREQDVALIEMRFFEEMAFKEIAYILDITENNAKVRTYRVLDRLKTIFDKHYSRGHGE